MYRTFLVSTCLAATAFAQDTTWEEPPTRSAPRATTEVRAPVKFTEADTWTNRSNFYAGVRGGVGIPPGAVGVAGSAALEVGIATSRGMGVGLSVSWMQTTPGAPALGIPPTSYGLGASLDLRYYFETIEPLTLYPALSLGFLAGPAIEGQRNVVLPIAKPGFGARVLLGSLYLNLEFGLANFTIPYLGLGIGFQADRAKERRAAWEADRKEQRALADEAERREEERQARREARSRPAVEPAGVAAPH